MIRYFNFHEQGLAIVLLAAVQILPHLVSPPPGWPLIVDAVSLFVVIHLVGGYLGFLLSNLGRLPTLASIWIASKDNRRALAIVREFAIWAAVLFLILRLSRWSLGWAAGWRMDGSAHYDNYLDAALMLLLLSFALSARRVVRMLGRINLTSGRRLIASYVILVLGSTLLLMLPISVQTGQQLELIDAAFTVVSAVSVTGLSVMNISSILSPTGQILVLLLIQIGGLGIIVITAGLAAATWRRLSLEHSMLGKELYDIPDFGNMGVFLTKVTIFTLSLELVGAGLLFLDLPVTMERRFFHALFHAVSAFCNAGFSTLPANLESSPFGGFGLGVICVLIVVGGLGFPILFEVIGALNKGPRKRRFSANSRLTLAVTGSLLLVGAVSIFMMQTFTHGNELSTQQRFWQSIFYSISSRTAGFNMVPVHQLGATSVLVIMVLMAIGGGPMSTAGGMKTTTVGVLIATAWATVSGRGQAQFAGRTIPDITIHRAVSGVVIYLFVASSATLMLVLLEGLDPWALLFEVVSALSTVGLTLGVTEQLSGPGKFIILTLMLVGRIGLVTFLYAGMGRIEPRRYRYPKDRFFVG